MTGSVLVLPELLAAATVPPLLVLMLLVAALVLELMLAVAAVVACCDCMRLCLLALSAASASLAASSSLPVQHWQHGCHVTVVKAATHCLADNPFPVVIIITRGTKKMQEGEWQNHGCCLRAQKTTFTVTVHVCSEKFIGSHNHMCTQATTLDKRVYRCC